MMNILRILDLAIATLNKNVAVFGLAAGTFLTFVNVVLRYVFNSGLSWASELGNYFFIWSAFFAAAYGFRQGIHISVTILLERFPSRFAKACFIFANLLTVIFLICIVYYSIHYLKILDEISQMSQDLNVPQWVPMLVLPIAFSTASYRAFEKAIIYYRMEASDVVRSATHELTKDAVSGGGAIVVPDDFDASSEEQHP